MSRSLDNENPTIFTSTAPTSSKRRPKSAKALLWSDEADGFEEYAGGHVSGSSGDEEEREEIDAEEVFGMYLITVFSASRLIRGYRSATIHY
jgi:hypothetical protein